MPALVSSFTSISPFHLGLVDPSADDVSKRFAWTVEFHQHWLVTIASTFFYGLGQVMIINCTQNYYIDAFEKYAASAIAAGAVFRFVFGGLIPLFAPSLFKSLGYGWGVSVFAFIGVVLAPAPLLFYRFGERIRGRFIVNL